MASPKNKLQTLIPLFILSILLLFTLSIYAQSGEQGIDSATNLMKGYFARAQILLYAIGGVVGVVGAVKVYNKWAHGEQDTNKVAAAWFGACIFLVVVATVLKAFFGL